MKLKSLFLLGLLLVGISSWASPSVNFKWIRNSSGDYQLAISGRDLCDSAKFRIRVTSLRSDETDWYTSRSGKSEWQIEKCGIKTMMLNKDVMTPGHILEVRTYTYQGNRNHSFRKTIPCEESDWGSAFSGQDVYEGATAQLASCGSGPRPPMPPIPPPRPQPTSNLECSQSAMTPTSNSQLVRVSVRCNFFTPVRVSVRQISSVGSPLGQVCSKMITAQDTPQLACSLTRDPNSTFLYKVVLSKAGSNEEILNERGMVFKMPTYSYPADGRVVSDRYITPKSKRRPLGNGIYWSIPISVRVQDDDLSYLEQRKLIKVVARVTNANGERELETMYGNTGDVLEFNLSHHYIEPIIFGKPHHSNEGFILGDNKVTFEIYDAYDGPVPSRIAEEVVVILQ